MATETTNYHFSKPAETDYYDVNVQNNNWDVADQTLKGVDDEKVDKNGGDIANTEVSEFAASSTEWPVPVAGEAPKTLWGKTKKFFEDFKNWMTGVCLLGQLVSNNTTNNTNLPASAAAVYQEAQLRAQQIAQLNSDLNGIIVGNLTLNYVNSTTMWGESDPLAVNKYGIGIPVCSVAIVDETPYDAVEELAVTINEENKVEVNAKGSGFVAGHRLRVNYICK